MVLDLLVTAAEEGDLPVTEWIGESHLMDWFWDTRVRARVDMAGSQSLMELGRRQADSAELDTAISDVVPQSAVEPLLKAGLLRERDERVVFDHDAVADWARFRWLLGQGKNLNTALEQRSSNPLWHSAIRLVASRQLEQSSSTDQWEALIDGCEAVTDFALDALLFAADSDNLLTRVADRLFADEAACKTDDPPRGNRLHDSRSLASAARGSTIELAHSIFENRVARSAPVSFLLGTVAAVLWKGGAAPVRNSTKGRRGAVESLATNDAQ
jgi:hypothetical protein